MRAGVSAAGGDAGVVAGADVGGDRGGGALAGDAGPSDLAKLVGDVEAQGAVVLPVGDLGGDVGDHWSPSGQLAGVLGEPEQGQQRYLQLDDRSPALGPVSQLDTRQFSGTHKPGSG